MKWLFILLVFVNLGLYGFSKLETPPASINITQREVNASQVRVVTGQLGNSAEPTASEHAITPSPESSAENHVVTPTPAITPKPTAQATPQTMAGHCWRWAGVTGEQIETARSKIKSLGLTASETSSGESTKVWVYMPPLDNLEIAKQKAAQLADMGVSDYFVVNNGGRWQNAISLGIFSTREAGERHLTELKALGVKSAVVRDRDDTLKQASFFLKDLTDTQSEKAKKLASQFAGSVLREVKCK